MSKSKKNKPSGKKTKSGRNSQQGKPSGKSSNGSYAFEIVGREHILEHLTTQAAPANLRQLMQEFGYAAESDEAEALRRRLGAMCRDAQLIQNRNGAYLPVKSSDLIAGYVSANSAGFGFVNCDDGNADIYVNAKQMRQVLHGDKVVVCITGVDNRGRREGRITDVVERAHTDVVGRLTIEPGVTFVRPSNNRIHMDFLVQGDDLGDARDGDMVLLKITEQPSRRHPPVGRIVEVLGQHLEAGMEIDVALRSHGIPFEWPKAVQDQVSGFKSAPDKNDIEGRRDITKLPLVTIDGEDARDFDDAVYCEKNEDGWRLYVAIADVSHYVQPGSPLDKEATQRGTSVYFPEQVVPMFPEVLSNGLCSINPDVERLCMLCVMSLDDKGNLKRTRFQRAVMRSHARLTYTQVADMIEARDKNLRQQYKKLVPHLENLHRLYKRLLKLRERRGSIEFESQESRFVFDENRKIKAIVPVQRNVAHRMIEECMVLANVAAAAYLLKRKVPALYRVHHGPTEDRLDDLRGFLALRGLSLGGGDQPDTTDFAKLAREAAKLPDAAVVQTVMLRSMQAAVYQPGNDGHFGLALPHYAHFTSPIRRYPDLLVHRALGHVIDGGKSSDYFYGVSEMEHLGESCSMTERRAEEATRDVVGWLKCEFMQHRIGDDFNGVVASVTSFGLFIQLKDMYIDGLVHVSTLGFDYFHFDPAALTLVGERTGTRFGLGDPVRVRVANVDLDERKIDFELIDAKVGRKSRRKSGGKSRRKGEPESNSHEVEKGKAKRKGKSSSSRKKVTKKQGRKRREKNAIAASGKEIKTNKYKTRKKTAKQSTDEATDLGTDLGKKAGLDKPDSKKVRKKPKSKSRVKPKSESKAKAKTKAKTKAKAKSKSKSRSKTKHKAKGGSANTSRKQRKKSKQSKKKT